MGCAGSKQYRRNRTTRSPFPRSYSVPVHHHPPQRKGDPHRAVALTSTTLGSLKLANGEGEEEEEKFQQRKRKMETSETGDFGKEVLQQAKTWSTMIEEKIPIICKTPTRTPPSEPEMINTWELMAGLEEDYSPLRFPAPDAPPIDRSFSFHSFFTPRKSKQNPKTKPITPPSPVSAGSPKPRWGHMNFSDSIVADFDPEIISTFRRALEEISPANNFILPSPEKLPARPNGQKTGIVQARVSAFQEKINAKKAIKAVKILPAYKCPPGGEDKIVFYFTSLRGIRKTYEDCCRVRMILKGFGVRIDERDVSMHFGFREELNELLGDGSVVPLPRVFVKGRYLGGPEDLRQMHEAGELEKILEGCELEQGGSVCEGCGNVRFVNCETCFGSCKLFDEEEEVFQRCPDCNENGIVRCPLCSD